MAELGVLPTVASLVRTGEPLIGLAVHMTISSLVGAGLGLLLHGRWSAGETLFWGVTYASFFWLLGPLTLMPMILGRAPTWDLAAAQMALPSLFGHVVWGATAGASLALIRARLARAAGSGATADASSSNVTGVWSPADPAPDTSRPFGAVARGVVGGLLGLIVLALIPFGPDRMMPAWAEPAGPAGAFLPFALALTAGGVYGVFHPRSMPTAGAAVVRGACFGILIWVAFSLTAIPILSGRGLDWTIADAQGAFPALLGMILFGASLALGVQVQWRVARTFFSDHVGSVAPDAGAWGLRAVGRGAAGGLIGGLLFLLVMLQVGSLPGVGRLVGSGSDFVAIAVHLVIAQLVGASYGLLFRRQSFDRTSALGWGVAYGFLWWVIGPLTLAPIILGSAPAWTAAAAADAFPSLVGHLAYGAALGMTFHALEARFSPWWISRSEAEASRIERRRTEALSAGPALGALLVLIAVLLPVLLARSA